MLYQQGDVLLKVVKKVDLSKAKKVERESGRLILAHGEVTGHAHAVLEEGVELFEVDGVLYCKAKEAFEVKHEEHKTVKVPPGTYEVHRVKEYDHFAEEAKQVRD
jgi:hypothetical protein